MIGNPLQVEAIVSEMRRGGIRVPEIQRSYVWRRSQIARLLDSVYRGFPAGSILLWDTIEPIIDRELATDLGAGVRADFVPKIVLDGQQRITSLGRVFDSSAPKSERMLFNLMEEVFEPYSPRNGADPRWLDVTELMTGQATELDVLDRLTEAGVVGNADKAEKNRLLERLKRLTGIRKYQFPVEIVREQDLEVVTEIFIRVNSAGTRLREAELALARLAWKLPGTIIGPFEQAVADCELRGFDLDMRFLMRALVAVATRQARFTDLKGFWQRPAAEIEEAWRKTDRGLRLTLDFVEGNVGIPGSDLLPSFLSLIPLIAIFAERDQISGAEERLLRRWFLLANAFSRYVGASETKLNQDLTTLGPQSKGTEGLPEQLRRDLRSEPRLTTQDLERAGTSSPFFPLAYLAVLRRDATDWFKGIKLRRESFSEDQNIEYHHIFPKRLLDDRGVDRFVRDEMGNIAFLGQRANRKIRATPPAQYLAAIAEDAPERLTAQFVPLEPALWDLDRFPEFLVERRKLLVDAMNEVLEA